MSRNLRRLQYLPWGLLLQASAITTGIVIFIELIVAFGYEQSALIRRTLGFLYTPPLGGLLVLATAVGVGALAIVVIERFFPRLSISSAILWALIPCLLLMLFVKSLLPVPSQLINIHQPLAMGFMLGIFWKGRPYWH